MEEITPMSFSCPFCNWSSEDFDETDEHYTEHITEYQQSQNEFFGKFSQ